MTPHAHHPRTKVYTYPPMPWLTPKEHIELIRADMMAKYENDTLDYYEEQRQEMRYEE